MYYFWRELCFVVMFFRVNKSRFKFQCLYLDYYLHVLFLSYISSQKICPFFHISARKSRSEDMLSFFVFLVRIFFALFAGYLHYFFCFWPIIFVYWFVMANPMYASSKGAVAKLDEVSEERMQRIFAPVSLS